jgi:hypothetical protein
LIPDAANDFVAERQIEVAFQALCAPGNDFLWSFFNKKAFAFYRILFILSKWRGNLPRAS